MSNKSLKIEIITKMSELATAGFGLVAALAWNDAIQSLFKEIFGTQSAVWAKFAYAVIVTALVVLVIIKLGNILNKLKENNNGDQNKQS
jgi:hypothetical protein